MALLNVRSLHTLTTQSTNSLNVSGIFPIYKPVCNVNEDNYLNPTNSKNKIKTATFRENTIKRFYVPTESSYLGRLGFELDLCWLAHYKKTFNISNQDIYLGNLCTASNYFYYMKQ